MEAVDQIISSNRQLAKQMFEMQKQFQEVKLLHSKSGPTCVTCGGFNCSERCMETLPEEEVKYMGQAPFSNNYNSGWRNHPNLSWRDQGNNHQRPHNNQNFQSQGSSPQEQGQSSGKKSIEELLEGFMARTESNYKAQEAISRDQGATIRNLEVQVGQLAKHLSERLSDEFPGDTQKPRMENA